MWTIYNALGFLSFVYLVADWASETRASIEQGVRMRLREDANAAQPLGALRSELKSSITSDLGFIVAVVLALSLIAWPILMIALVFSRRPGREQSRTFYLDDKNR